MLPNILVFMEFCKKCKRPTSALYYTHLLHWQYLNCHPLPAPLFVLSEFKFAFSTSPVPIPIPIPIPISIPFHLLSHNFTILFPFPNQWKKSSMPTLLVLSCRHPFLNSLSILAYIGYSSRVVQWVILLLEVLKVVS